MNVWYALFSLIALPGILTVLLPQDDVDLDDDESLTRRPVAKAILQNDDDVLPGTVPIHMSEAVPGYRFFFRRPARQFF